MKVALRVLTALSEKRIPSAKDVEELGSYAGPQPAHMELDEFACEVIQTALRNRAEKRTARGAA